MRLRSAMGRVTPLEAVPFHDPLDPENNSAISMQHSFRALYDEGELLRMMLV